MQFDKITTKKTAGVGGGGGNNFSLAGKVEMRMCY